MENALEKDYNGEPFKVDWENLSKRLLAAMQLGVRIEQDSGHRWIQVDASADKFDHCLAGIRSKEYGSYMAALDRIDALLKQSGEISLLERFHNLMPYNDLGFVFGSGVQ